VDKLLVAVNYLLNMSKFLQKEIKRSVPVIVIFCLINVLVLGFSFNLNLNFVKSVPKGFINMAPDAEAATATTSVIVKNSPPHFTSGPAENPTSSSTSPINVGGSIGFRATAVDDEGDNYWLIVCSGNKATSSLTLGVPPSCVASTQFCISSEQGTGVQASCTYNNITDPGSETQTWYAFVCDDHDGDQRCSALGQGAGDSGSPFYVNHAPHINNLYTSSDFKNPGVAVTITASTTDYDHASGNYNVQSLFVCSTNSWTVGGGCGGTELCHGSSTVPSTASSSVSCTYTIPIPKMHTAYSYYGFVKDQYKMPATTGQGATSNYNVNNVAPVVSNVTLNAGNNISLNIKGAPQVMVNASSTSVTDDNGCTDLSSATSTIYLSSVAGGNDCAANNSNCYQIGTGFCNVTNCAGASSVSATVTCSTTLAFFTMPTDASSIASTSSWFSAIRAADALGLKGLGIFSGSTVDVNSNAALNVVENAIPYGTVQAGTNTGSVNASTTVVNYGNTPIDAAVSGTDMLKNKVGPEKIRINNQQHSKNTFTFTAGNTSSTTPDTVTIGIPRPINLTDVTSKIYWGINVPAGTPSATFYGMNTFTVVLNKNDNWQYP
jgi:hypothetical protein